MYQPIKVKESIQLVTTPTNHPKSVLINSKKTKLEEFIMNIQNMSPFRFILFMISILFCFAVIIGVLFIVPCEWSNCISPKNIKLIWSDSVFIDIELKGKPSSIELNQKLIQLLFIVRGSILNSQNVPPRTERLPSIGGGLLQIDTITGKEMWRKRLDSLPDTIDCTLLNNQFKENKEVYCIIGASNRNILAVVSSSKNKGDLVWKKNRPESNTTKLNNINDLVYTEFPVIIPDCNSDGVNEMAFVHYENNMPTLDILSGKSGNKMSSIRNDNCTKMTDLILNYDMSLVYFCRKDTVVDPLETIPIKTILNCSRDWIPDSVHQTKREHDQIEENQYFSTLGPYNLWINNSYFNCPTNCTAIVYVTNNFNETVWSKKIDRSYIMKPVTFELRNNISGFVIKIWSWNNETIENKIKLTNIEKVKYIQEQVIVITYNSSRLEDFHIKNISSNKIIQVCENESNCQPKLEYQKYSLNVMDIDNDGHRELVSVLVTYQFINSFSQFYLNDKHSLQLISKVNVYQLENQLIGNFENGMFV
uniref:FAM234A/B beta-propeller domain-containing protein n=1 Tax=Schizaphis graminum TaxID=13262 RepID=A0A2S2NUQ9_SCHGA